MRRKNQESAEDPIRFAFSDIVTVVVFFAVLFIFVQQLQFIEVFEQAKVRTLQDYLAGEIREAFQKSNYGDRIPKDTVDANTPLVQKIIMDQKSLRFDVAEAQFQTEQDAQIIDLIGKVLKDNNGIIESVKVEGHTDSDPINEECYPSNWELSSARAATVVHRLTDVSKFPPEKISAVGFSQYHPINKKELHLNRRIEFLIFYSYDKALIGSETAKRIYEKVEHLKKVEARGK